VFVLPRFRFIAPMASPSSSLPAFVGAPFSAQVSGVRNVQENPSSEKVFTQYTILVSWPVAGGNGSTWTVSRRFSDFETLRGRLAPNCQELPPLPAKTWLADTSPEFIEKRRGELHAFLQTLLDIPYIILSETFMHFLDVDNNVVRDKSNIPTEIRTVSSSPFGVAAMTYFDRDMVVFTCCEDASFLSRLDTKLATFKLPWESGTPSAQVAPVGSLNCWRAESNTGNWCRLNTTFFNESPSVVSWDPVKRYAFVGFEDGKIECYYVDEDYKQLSSIKRIDKHTDRVTGMVYCGEKDYLITCSRDKNVLVYSMKDDAVVSFGNCGKAMICAIAYDYKNSRVFLGTYSTNILAYDVADSAPVLSASFPGHTGSIRALDFHAASGDLFSGGFDSLVGVWKMEKVKCLLFCHKFNRVVTGLDNGKLAIWDTSIGKLLYVVNAHSKPVTTLQFIDDAEVLLSGSLDGLVKCWTFTENSLRLLQIQARDRGFQEEDKGKPTVSLRQFVTTKNTESEEEIKSSET
jgi:WD40 repeat protein